METSFADIQHQYFSRSLELAPTLQPLRILLVEDDASAECFWTAVIERIHPGSSVDWANNEEDAEWLIEKAAEYNHAYDLVIVDIFLCGPKTGVDLWLKYHKLLGSRILMTSSIEESKLFNYLLSTSEMPNYVRKPLNATECKNVIRKMVALV